MQFITCHNVILITLHTIQLLRQNSIMTGGGSKAYMFWKQIKFEIRMAHYFPIRRMATICVPLIVLEKKFSIIYINKTHNNKTELSECQEKQGGNPLFCQGTKKCPTPDCWILMILPARADCSLWTPSC